MILLGSNRATKDQRSKRSKIQVLHAKLNKEFMRNYNKFMQEDVGFCMINAHKPHMKKLQTIFFLRNSGGSGMLNQHEQSKVATWREYALCRWSWAWDRSFYTCNALTTIPEKKKRRPRRRNDGAIYCWTKSPTPPICIFLVWSLPNGVGFWLL